MQKLCIALRFYATGSHQIVIGDGEGASQASVSRIVKQVTLALAGHADDLISFNIDQEVLETVAKGFYGFSGNMYESYVYIAGGRCIIKWKCVYLAVSKMEFFLCFIVEFPNIAGIIDCTHVPVRSPKENKEQFIDKDGDVSLNVQAHHKPSRCIH